ncbi:MAG: D-alanyl-lipoteichoic acid biosynthesis protein DltD [Peptococcaceae bacterium]|nr:D-alanyl-lipoteichoic acid biosynthesis protein DltD [Peptococcaceae bacterium]
MKRFIPLLLSLVVVYFVLSGVDKAFTSKVESRYYPAFGDELNDRKNQGMALQEAALKRGDSIPIYGSSELSGTQKPYHPVTFFASWDDGIQVNLVGRGYCQSLIHLINFGALGDSLQGKKIVVIISPQWFSKYGLTADNFKMNFSEQQYLAFMNNTQISPEMKAAVAKRVQLLNQGGSPEVNYLSALYSRGTGPAKGLRLLLNPYFQFEEYLLSLKDKVKSSEILSARNPSPRQGKYSKEKTNWDQERKIAQSLGQAATTNNSFSIENGYYDKYIKDNLAAYKGKMKNDSYLESPEYGDLELLLKLCKELEMKPLFVSVPVNGWWYDYCGFPRNDREQYYAKIRQMISSYGFELADFSGHEYDQYFLQDVMHLGWKGWVDIDEAIVSYFN